MFLLALATCSLATVQSRKRLPDLTATTRQSKKHSVTLICWQVLLLTDRAERTQGLKRVLMERANKRSLLCMTFGYFYGTTPYLTLGVLNICSKTSANLAINLMSPVTYGNHERPWNKPVHWSWIQIVLWNYCSSRSRVHFDSRAKALHQSCN